MTTQVLTPVGRIVSGSVSNPQTTDYHGKPLTWATGQYQGQPRTEVYVGLAIRKDDPGLQAMLDLMSAEATAGWPRGWGNLPFAWKMIDGDGMDSKQQPYSSRPGYAGCFVFRWTTSFAPRTVRNDGTGTGNVIDMPAEDIKTGHFVRIAGSFEGNKNAEKPGLYLNLNMVEWVAYGEEIISGPNPNQVFNQPVTGLPQGASATPLAAASSMNHHAQGGMPQGQPQYQQPGQGQPPQGQSPQGQPQYQQPGQGQPPQGQSPQGQPQYQQPGQGQPPQGQSPQGQPQYQQPGQGQPPQGQSPQGQPQYQQPGQGQPPQGQPMQPNYAMARHPG